MCGYPAGGGGGEDGSGGGAGAGGVCGGGKGTTHRRVAELFEGAAAGVYGTALLCAASGPAAECEREGGPAGVAGSGGDGKWSGVYGAAQCDGGEVSGDLERGIGNTRGQDRG